MAAKVAVEVEGGGEGEVDGVVEAERPGSERRC
ncbi:hypothetical protein SMD44_03711 [Streptomyces alboflavus]|uniref:Uncharacterized protein n=1 Tax=Streptomyces alboflavus TaxID=67267 RepID=A0A1Z1WCT7_9ACTN|nr:hypothetical protein SMD44_03711 [Streptomyces alboflavus]